MCFGAELEVITSREFKCAGAIGLCSSLDRKSSSVADTEIGIGNTNAWRLGGIHPNSTIALYFDVVNTNAQQVATEQRQSYLQIRTKVSI
jgi:protein transport protein SEC23